MNTFSHVPPGFRFHPTDEELVDYYLRKKVASRKIDLDVIKDVDLYKIEPWDLQGNQYILHSSVGDAEFIDSYLQMYLFCQCLGIQTEKCKIGTEEQSEWYFFSHKDKKYPTGTRTNRATTAGFWKATGRDKPIYSKNNLVGMRKTLVFYKGRAPNGQKSDWIMHEYRLETNEYGSSSQEEGWAVCRVFKKRATATQRLSEHELPCWYNDHAPFIPDLDSPKVNRLGHQMDPSFETHLYSCKPELELNHVLPHEPFLQLPQLVSPKLMNCISHAANLQASTISSHEELLHQPSNQLHAIAICGNNGGTDQSSEHVMDWRVLDKFVASQLSHDNANKEPNYSDSANMFQVSDKQEEASTSGSSSQIDMWK